MILGLNPNEIRRNSRKGSRLEEMRPIRLLTARKDAASDQKRLKNRLYTTVAGKKLIVTRMW